METIISISRLKADDLLYINWFKSAALQRQQSPAAALASIEVGRAPKRKDYFYNNKRKILLNKNCYWMNSCAENNHSASISP